LADLQPSIFNYYYLFCLIYLFVVLNVTQALPRREGIDRNSEDMDLKHQIENIEVSQQNNETNTLRIEL